MTTPYRLRPMTTTDLGMVLAWRNRPEVRANMYTRHEIGAAEHSKYFEHVFGDPSKQYLICIDRSDSPVGLVNFTNIDQENETAVMGSYVGEPMKGGTVGAWLEYLALEDAFRNLALAKVTCEVLGWNQRAVGFHEKFGFTLEGTFRAQVKRDGLRHDVFRLGILAPEWHTRRNHIRRLLGMKDD